MDMDMDISILMVTLIQENDWCCMNALTEKALALLLGLNLAETDGCNWLIIQSDNLEVDETIKAGGWSSGVVAVIFYDCYHMAYEFPYVVFEHCYGEQNCVAHELAKLARGPLCNSWMEEQPDVIIHVLINDVTIVSGQ